VAPDGVDRELAPDEPVQVEAVADDGVDALDAGLPKDVDQLPGRGLVSQGFLSACSSSAVDSFVLRRPVASLPAAVPACCWPEFGGSW
jgi:hypothetical protein